MKRILERYPALTLGHGGGGRLTRQLVDELFRPLFASPWLDEQGDSAVIDPGAGRLAFTTDSFVVRPLFFPGGDIGRLAVIGTCNDLAMAGARPGWLSLGLIIEEGFPTECLARIAESMAGAAADVGARIVAGDTKVVERGRGDGLYLNTSGVGLVELSPAPAARLIRPGDAILVSGAIGRHGIAIMASREGLEFEAPVVSDCAHLWPAVRELARAAVAPRALRDLTRGGLATALIELSLESGLQFSVNEAAIPVDAAVRGACELLGLDALYVANEGRLVAFVPAEAAATALATLRAFDPAAQQIGSVLEHATPGVRLSTRFGTSRWLELQSGEELPRIC